MGRNVPGNRPIQRSKVRATVDKGEVKVEEIGI
jgi:hypothetical protein